MFIQSFLRTKKIYYFFYIVYIIYIYIIFDKELTDKKKKEIRRKKRYSRLKNNEIKKNI